MEVKQREETISQLQNSIKALSNANLETTRDKIALCMELNEVAVAKEHLSNSLNTEIKKNISLDELRKDHENDTMTKASAPKKQLYTLTCVISCL